MKVFYSWQSDLLNATNRGFIERALESAAKSVRADETVEVEPVVDRDTTGVPGAPDIAGTIFAKIEEAQVFVCDVSIINQGTEARPTPNPNVLIELGYALKTLGPSRIMMIVNTAYGGPELLPFDLRMRRVITYNMSPEAEERAAERKRLEAILEEGLRTIAVGLERPLPGEATPAPRMGEQARAAVENSRPGGESLARKFMKGLTSDLVALAPDLSRGDDLDERLVRAIDQTEELVLEFSSLSEAVAGVDDRATALALYKGFGPLLGHYRPQRGFSGTFREVDFDFYKFVGHELFVTLFSFLVREERWELVADLLSEQIYVDNLPTGASGLVHFAYVSRYVGLLEHRRRKLELGVASLHAHILNERHTTGELGRLVPTREFADADYFLFLRAELEAEEEDRRITWKPWSAPYMTGPVPRYLAEATRAKYAERLLRPLGVKDLETLRERLSARAGKLELLFRDSVWFDSPVIFNPREIGRL